MTMEEVTEEIQKAMDGLQLERTPESSLKQTNENVNRQISFSLNKKKLSTDLRLPHCRAKR